MLAEPHFASCPSFLYAITLMRILVAVVVVALGIAVAAVRMQDSPFPNCGLVPTLQPSSVASWQLSNPGKSEEKPYFVTADSSQATWILWPDVGYATFRFCPSLRLAMIRLSPKLVFLNIK